MTERASAASAEVVSAAQAIASIFGDAAPSSATAAPGSAPASRCPFAQMFTRASTASLADRLKASTKELHHAAEHHPLQQSIVRGTITRADYAAFARAMRQVHAAMESVLGTLAASDVRIGAIFHTRHHRLAAFDRDIALLDAGAGSTLALEVRPTEWLGQGTHNHPLAWLGVLYVVEGSSNGGQAIARVLRRAWSLDDDTLASLDPHGAATRELWGGFRTTLDAQSFSSEEQDAILRGAAATFAGITQLMDSLVAAPAAKS